MINTVDKAQKTNTHEEEITLLKKQNSELNDRILELDAKVKWYEEQLKINLHNKYGSSSEKTVISEQISIFNEAEVESKPEAKEPEIEEITYKRIKSRKTAEDRFEDIPVETVEYKLSEEEMVCGACGNEIHEMSVEVRREIEMTPPQVKVIEQKRSIYSCRECERNGIEVPIVKADMPSPVIPGSFASPSSIAYIADQKYSQGLPLYRQEKQLQRMDIELSRQTMANWLLKSSELWLSLIYDRMREVLLKRDIAHADETPLQVLKEPDRPAETKSYMLVYRTGREGPHIVLFDYQTTRAGKHAVNFLCNFKGYLHADGYSGYNNIPDVTLVGCWSHARRKFNDVLSALPKDKRNSHVSAKEGLEYCNRLFAIERSLADVTPGERYAERLERSKPVLDEFYKWLKYHKPRVLPKSAFGTAVKYCLNQWEKLCGFLKDGRLEIDNNRSERSIKIFVIGRKGWLFSNTARGAKTSAIIYSIVETAKENGLKPFEYMKYLFEEMPNMNIDDTMELDKLLPWADEIPEKCMLKKRQDK
jgi:transposase